MKRSSLKLFLTTTIIFGGTLFIMNAGMACEKESETTPNVTGDIIEPSDTLHYSIAESGDTIMLAVDPALRSGRLTERDYIEVAEELGIEVATIKAVVDIEAGQDHKGFWAEGKPIINFDLSVFRKMAKRNGVNLAHAAKTHPVIFASPNTKKYGSYQAAQQARLDAAREVDNKTAIEGTFWGMFQIGGSHWKLFDFQSPDEFVEMMSRSERDQLELFATFITKSGMLPALKTKNWAAFARKYNGAGYARKGYHKRMAKAYAKYSKN